MLSFRPDYNIKIKDFLANFSPKEREYINNIHKVEYPNTIGYRTKDAYKIRLYETDIVTMPDDRAVIILNTGGFYTNLTRNRINDFISGYSKRSNLLYSTNETDRGDYYPHIYQSKHVWYYVDTFRDEYRFFDGIEIDKRSLKVINPLTDTDTDSIDKEHKRIKKLIKEYCKAVNELDTLPNSSSGDCLYCQLYEVESNKPLGECVNDKDHLLSHLEEEYIMKSLIMRALQLKGYNYPLCIYDIYKYRKGDRDSITNALSNYFIKHLILC